MENLSTFFSITAANKEQFKEKMLQKQEKLEGLESLKIRTFAEELKITHLKELVEHFNTLINCSEELEGIVWQDFCIHDAYKLLYGSPSLGIEGEVLRVYNEIFTLRSLVDGKYSDNELIKRVRELAMQELKED